MQAHIDTLIQSDWFIRMLEKSSPQPKQRLLNVFALLEDWLSAPFQTTNEPTNRTQAAQATQLQDYLTQQAILAGSRSPEVLANQLYFMVLSAANTHLMHPESHSLKHAQQAAKALIEAGAQPFKDGATRTAWLYGCMALASIATLTFAITWFFFHQADTPKVAVQTDQVQPIEASLPLEEASPSETAAIYARLEMMRHGDCRFIEALQLPEQVKSIYIENVIQGRISQNRAEQRVVQELLDQVKCNYTPKLMLNSVS